MARKNRIVVHDGVYHLTTRIANREMLLRDDALKSQIVDWMYGVADFSGVEPLAWCVMENHLHIVVRVPPVPERYWLDRDTEPNASHFTIRPSVCSVPRWYPDGVCPPDVDKPEPRPPIGFMLSDDEMIDRLVHLYGSKTADDIAERWRTKRANGRGAEVDAEKERYCRRMYNVSQFAKTLKERIAMRYNADKRNHHAGCLFQGRFHSVVVGRTAEDFGSVASYVAVNPVKARIVKGFAEWRWSSFSVACKGDSPRAERCRAAYAKMFGCDWQEAKARMEELMSDRLPAGFDENSGSFSYDVIDENGEKRSVPLRATQVIWLKVKAFTQGGILSRDPAYVEAVLATLPKGFNHERVWGDDFLSRLDWSRAA